jgi:hypothetical protein
MTFSLHFSLVRHLIIIIRSDMTFQKTVEVEEC